MINTDNDLLTLRFQMDFFSRIMCILSHDCEPFSDSNIGCIVRINVHTCQD